MEHRRNIRHLIEKEFKSSLEDYKECFSRDDADFIWEEKSIRDDDITWKLAMKRFKQCSIMEPKQWLKWQTGSRYLSYSNKAKAKELAEQDNTRNQYATATQE